jgi:hypothetical protein
MIEELELKSPIVVVAPPKQRVKFSLNSPLEKNIDVGTKTECGLTFWECPQLGDLPIIKYDSRRKMLSPLPNHKHKIRCEMEEYHT